LSWLASLSVEPRETAIVEEGASGRAEIGTVVHLAVSPGQAKGLF
jgi:hypothetical protein